MRADWRQQTVVCRFQSAKGFGLTTKERLLRGTIMNALASWLGAGGTPVSHGLAEIRAGICVNCPNNSHGKWWEKSKAAIAETIRQILSFKAEQGIYVTHEENLFMCKACGCALRLKVHTPIKHITDNLDAEERKKLHPDCWILKET